MGGVVGLSGALESAASVGRTGLADVAGAAIARRAGGNTAPASAGRTGAGAVARFADPAGATGPSQTGTSHSGPGRGGAGPGGRGGPGAEASSAAGGPTADPGGDTAAPRTTTELLDDVDRLVELLQERIMSELERRGARFRREF
ncbi:MAG: hypothetical protein OEY23_11395 [Acidimicrobiia bacterium]|nr:hypothetical protein [Acidimicrobiia bacterium]